MKILFVRPGLGNEKKRNLLVRTCEPLELIALSEVVPEYLKDRVKISLLDMYLEKLPYKNILLSENPDLVLFYYEEGLFDFIEEYGKLTKEIRPDSLTAIAGDYKENFTQMDLQLGKNPAASFAEVILGIETERTIEEIIVKVRTTKDKDLGKEITLNGWKLEDKYIKSYNFLHHKGIYDVFSIKRFSSEEDFYEGKTHGELRSVEDILLDIQQKNGNVYLKDYDVFNDGNRLLKIVEGLEEKSLSGTYICQGDIYTTIVQRDLIQRFSKLGLKTMVLDLEYPEDEDGWLKIKEGIEVLRSFNVEPLFVIDEELTQEDEDALVFFLKENREGLVFLKDEAYEKNKGIYKNLSLGFVINAIWTKDLGLGEALRRNKKYKEALA